MTTTNEILDNIDLKNLKADRSFSNGYSFPVNARYMSGIMGVALLAGFFFSLVNQNYILSLIALVLLVIIAYILFSKNGVDLAFKDNYYREYISFLWFKTGQWKTAHGLTDVVILTFNKTRNIGNTLVAAGAVTPDLTVSLKETGVYLLTPTHRKRRLICVSKSYKEADQIATEIAEKMEKDYKIFNPLISEATKRRRY